jgi:hypothetical protein
MFQAPEPTFSTLPPSPKAKKAKPRGHEEWLELIAQWQSSGLTEQAFCDSIEVRLDTFRKHRYQANKVSVKKAPTRSGFKPVKITKPVSVDQAVIVLHASHCRLELPRDMDVSQVAELIKALGR